MAARRALTVAPDNLLVRSSLVEMLANEAVSPSQLQEIEADVRAALLALEGFRPPKTLPYPLWLRAERRVRRELHTALGIAAFKRGRDQDALRELEEANAADSTEVTQYRLAKLYLHLGRRDEARKLFESAIAGPDSTIQALAVKELEALRK